MIQAAMFDTKPYDRTFFEPYEKQDELTIKYFETRLTPDTAELARGFDVVITFVNDTVNQTVIELLHKMGVRLLALRCAGFNNVDLQAAQNKIKVVRVPAYSPDAVAEHAMALLLTAVRRIHKAYIRTKDFNFSLHGLTGFDLKGKTVGVIGTGKIGSCFVRICNGFGMRVLAFDPRPDHSLNVQYVSLDKLFKHSDIISLHCPLTAQNRHLINKETLSACKDSVYLINTSRGGLIDSDALVDALKSQKVGGACLDVYEEETNLFFEDNSDKILQDDILARLLSMPNVVITSHQAFLTREALCAIAQTTVNNILFYFHNNTLENEISYQPRKLPDAQA